MFTCLFSVQQVRAAAAYWSQAVRFSCVLETGGYVGPFVCLARYGDPEYGYRYYVCYVLSYLGKITDTIIHCNSLSGFFLGGVYSGGV